MTRIFKNSFRIICFLFLFILRPFILNAEIISDPEYGYSLDIPEGFNVSEYTEDGMSYRFSHKKLPVSLVLKLYADNSYSDCEASLCGTLDKFNAEYDIDTVSWCNVPVSISNFSMKINGARSSFSGWALSATLVKKGAFVVLLCYCDSDKADALNQIIISTLNSLNIESENKSAGVITTFAYPKEGSVQKRINILGKEINFTCDKSDSEAEKFLIDTEWAVLSNYADDEKWVEAWQRYYRMIYRDASCRLENFCENLKKDIIPLCKKRNPDKPLVELNEVVLAWLQSFEYKREVENSDFIDLISVLSGYGSDCDSRSMLGCIIMEENGVDSTLFVSKEYHHAVYGVDFDIAGAKLCAEEKWYLLCETTAKGVKPGLMASTMSDSNKWISVRLNDVIE